MIQTTFVRILPLTLLALLVLPLSGLAAFGAQAPAAPIPITYGQDVTLTTMNFHESLFEDDPADHPGLPWPAQREATATGNMARAALTAGLDEAGVAIARVGVEYDILPGPHNWDDIKNEPVVVTVQFTYTLAADWATGAGSSNANLAVRPLHAAPGWFDRLGFETGETGSRGDTVTRAYLTTPDLLGDKTLLETYVQAHTASGSVDSTSASEVTVQSIHFDFEPELVDLTFADLEVTQGIQNLANDMPLVEGRHTVVRAYAESDVKDQAGDVEDGPLPPAQLAWSSDLDGDLGTGREVLTDTLSFGRHEITLTATDDDGEMAEATITLHVVYRLFLPTIRKE